MALIDEIAPDEGEPVPSGAAANVNEIPAPVVTDSGGIGPAPTKPPASCSKINNIMDGPLFTPAAVIGAALKSRKSKHAAVTYRIKLLTDTISSINRAFTQNEDPKGSLINNLLARSENETIDIAKEISDFCSLNVTINVNSEEILNTEEDDDVRPEDYRADVEYIQKMCEYKYNSLDASIAQRMRSLDMVKSAIATKISRIQKGSLPSSRSSSSSRSINIRTNADSMKPASSPIHRQHWYH